MVGRNCTMLSASGVTALLTCDARLLAHVYQSVGGAFKNACTKVPLCE